MTGADDPIASDGEPQGPRTARVGGATGLVGAECVARLLDDSEYGSVVVLARRPLQRAHPKLRAHVIDFDDPPRWQALVSADAVFCCLGTTIRKAGTQEEFRRVDYGYAMAVATAARAHDAGQFLLVSALGAHPRAAAFYSRVKGELEAAVSNLGFPSVAIFRPSLLLGERGEYRRAEHLAIVFGRAASPLLAGPLRRYRPIEARTVAACMVKTARRPTPGVRVFESERIAAC